MLFFRGIFSVIGGVGEMDVYRNYQNQFSSTSKISLNDQTDLEFNERPFLIVDLRDRDEFRKNHIISGNLFS